MGQCGGNALGIPPSNISDLMFMSLLTNQDIIAMINLNGGKTTVLKHVDEILI